MGLTITLPALLAMAEALAKALIRIYDSIQQIKGDQPIPTLGDIIQNANAELTDIEADEDQIKAWLEAH